MTLRPVLSSLLIACALTACDDSTPTPAPAADPSAPPYEAAGLHHPGFASVPWGAAYAPDGRWLAIVEGHPQNHVSVYDGATNERVWTTTPERSPASYRPAFLPMGDRLVYVEGQDLLVRERGSGSWDVVRRVPLGVEPGTRADARPIVLSPDGTEAALAADEGVVRVTLEGPTAARRVAGTESPAAVTWTREGRLRVARWTAEAASTLEVDGEAAREILPFAVFAASADAKTWLVARGPRPEEERPIVLELVDASSRETLASFTIEGRGVWNFLTQAEFTPDGRHLVTIESLRIGIVRDARTGRVVQRIKEYAGDRMIGFAIRPDGRVLLTGGRRAREADIERALLLWTRR